MATYNNELYAVHGINQFLWSKLQALDIMKPEFYVSNIGGSNIKWTPIIPTQQIEEFTEGTDVDGTKAPFIVYNWNTQTIGKAWYTQVDQIVYVIYSQNESAMRTVMKYMIDLFKRWDNSADAVNTFLLSDEKYSRFRQYDYKSINLQVANGALPVEGAGDRMQAVVSISVTYTDESPFTKGTYA